MKETYRILIPSEYQALLDAIEKERLRICIESLMNTGMRYTELEYFAGHLKTFDSKNNAITLSAEATKTKRERVIHLTPAFSKRLYTYLREHKALDVPIRRTMDDNLKRWWNRIQRHEQDPDNYSSWYPSTKTFRKTWATYLTFARTLHLVGERTWTFEDVYKSMGHSPEVLMRFYYSGSPVLKSESDAVRKLTEGWGK